MPQKHSKNNSDRGHFTYHEKSVAEHGSITQRLGVDSQLPFGYCCLSLHPAEDPVVSPSGHLYSREAILEYLLQKTLDIKRQARAYEIQQNELIKERLSESLAQQEKEQIQFTELQDGIKTIVKRKASEMEDSKSYMSSRARVIDDTDKGTQIAILKQVAPWVPQFTPEAKESAVAPPSKRPASPMTGRPLRAKDLIPIQLERETTSISNNNNSNSNNNGNGSGAVRFICPVSRKTITTQKVILIKSTGVIMLEKTAKELAFPSMVCPITNKPFTEDDLLELVSAASGFAASGQVEARKYRPSIN